jgi:hypothetical protein
VEVELFGDVVVVDEEASSCRGPKLARRGVASSAAGDVDDEGLDCALTNLWSVFPARTLDLVVFCLSSEVLFVFFFCHR